MLRLVGMCVLLFPLAAAAQADANIEKGKKQSSKAADAALMAQLADNLVAYGDRNKDALALISAARIHKQIGTRFEKMQKDKEGQPGAKPKSAAVRDNSVAAILERAKKYAGGRKDLIAIADEIAKQGSRGELGGPRVWNEQVLPKDTDLYRLKFVGGTPAVVFISGDGDIDLDLIVKDDGGNVVCVADGDTDREACNWIPRRTAEFRIEIKNLGNVYNNYRAGHN